MNSKSSNRHFRLWMKAVSRRLVSVLRTVWLTKSPTKVLITTPMGQWALRKKMKRNNKLLWRRVTRKKTLMAVEWMSLNTWNKLRNWFLWRVREMWNLTKKIRIRMKMSWLANRRTRTCLVAESVLWRMKTLITLWFLLANVRVRWESSICSVLKHGLLASE